MDGSRDPDSARARGSDFPCARTRTARRSSNRGFREKSQKVRSFIQSVLGGGDDEDNDFEPPPSSGDESDYQRAEDEEDDDDGSVASYESDDVSVYSQSSYSTISSSTPAKRKWTRRAHSPVFLQERELPALALPKSSEDLILPTCHTMRALSIYETLRHFRNILRLTPFRFEDFCVALMSDEQSGAALGGAHRPAARHSCAKRRPPARSSVRRTSRTASTCTCTWWTP
ncbi:hypothetical protein MRX96_033232 [Rhipicephalus microplus]